MNFELVDTPINLTRKVKYHLEALIKICKVTTLSTNRRGSLDTGPTRSFKQCNGEIYIFFKLIVLIVMH